MSYFWVISDFFLKKLKMFLRGFKISNSCIHHRSRTLNKGILRLKLFRLLNSCNRRFDIISIVRGSSKFMNKIWIVWLYQESICKMLLRLIVLLITISYFSQLNNGKTIEGVDTDSVLIPDNCKLHPCAISRFR